MINNKRLFPRIKVNFKVGFEFVDWKEKNLTHCKNSFEANIIDISANGASLSAVPDISKGFLKKLNTGKKKIRLSFLLKPGNIPVNTFARLIWCQMPGKGGSDEKQYGFEFIDIPQTAFDEIKSYVEASDIKEY